MPRRLTVLFMAFWLVFLAVKFDSLLGQLQRQNPAPLPFGAYVTNGRLYSLDFTYNLVFFHGIWNREVAHPYRPEDQELIVRHALLNSPSGMLHGYSPVALVLALPLLALSSHGAYLVFLAVNGVLTLLLVYYYLLPRVMDYLRFVGATGSVFSVWFATTLLTGQTVFFTTAVLAAFWAALNYTGPARLTRDIITGAMFWTLCLKPNVAIVPLLMLLGAQSWRALAIGFGLLLATWAALGNDYGGWWDGLADYLHLLTNYTDAGTTPFMHHHDGDPVAQFDSRVFLLKKYLLLLTAVALCLLRWAGHISLSEQFRGMLWAFLLLSPYLLGTENWVICLLVVEGPFFVSGSQWARIGKLLLILAVFNIRPGIDWPAVSFVLEYLKWTLFTWSALEWIIQARQKQRDEIHR